MCARFDSPLPRMARYLLVPAILFCIVGLQNARAQTDVAWEATEVVDSNVTELSSATGECAVYLAGTWHVFYCRDGQVRRRVKGLGGWGAAEDVSTAPSAAANPHAKIHGGKIFVVWEDSRTGTVEVWSRTWANGAWSAESCLTPSPAPSLAPMLATCEESSRLALVWQEGTASSQIFCRFHYDSWEAPIQVSHSPGSATEPTACEMEYFGQLVVVWTDDRWSSPRLFYSAWSGSHFDSETQVEAPTGAARHPSLVSQPVGGDLLYSYPILLFELTVPEGVSEIWAACNGGFTQLHRVSADDGIPSVLPAITSFRKLHYTCFFWASTGMEPFVTWTDLDGTRTHRVSRSSTCPTSTDPVDLISGAGLDRAVTIATEGDPSARLLSLWIEETESGSMLLARSGSTPGCERYGILESSPLLLVPGSGHHNAVRVGGACTGIPTPDFSVRLEFSPQVEADLTWDPAQAHPNLHGMTDDEGWVDFTLRGGGCATSGWVRLACDDEWGNVIDAWWGAKSPDIDGDCAVHRDDVETILARFGTNDFCADLDGSGLVDSADVTFARSLLGAHCTDPAGLDPGEHLIGPSLEVRPNPCRDQAILRLRGMLRWESVRIVSAQGRLVRSWIPAEQVLTPEGVVSRLVWDLRDQDSHPVPSGVYWVLARAGGTETRASLLVTR